ncbi:hypothetical protein [Sedimenticola hydrogenitrophicus]|uniref:hypothetical protein n=1 Tax=Sedimenticola hydrogenitrophicus TaxID=2967975 RepID=UPI0021A5758B|nr:hypothetical protein [Sedimenticola hydrogenitrophicus]
MNWKRYTALLLPGLLLAGCYTAPQRPLESVGQRQPAPVSSEPDSAAVVTPAEERGIQITAYEPAPAIPLTPLHSRAVGALLTTALEQERTDDLNGAVGTIERALRIEPRNAHLWYRLAGLRLIQGRHLLAADLANKSLTLAGGDVALKRDSWQLIARARRAAGDVSGANVAERKARMLQ